MRNKIVAGNWKMNLSLDEGKTLINVIEADVNPSTEVYVFTPSIYLHPLLESTKGTSIIVGAQNGYPEKNGAFTGEVSMYQLKELGVNSVLIGHSERRSIFNETSEFIKRKVDTAIAADLKVFFCCGETLEQRTEGAHFDIIKKQLKQSLLHLKTDDFRKIVLAYEPVWAIGTGKTASTDDAEAMHKHIRSIISQEYGSELANEVRILYGGSCKPSNATDLFSEKNIDGGLIGGASLKASVFNEIIKAS